MEPSPSAAGVSGPGPGSRVLVLGSGTAFNTDGRGSQALAVSGGSAGSFLFDVGPTMPAAAERFGFDPAGLEAVFITHLHGDHTAGWPFLLLGQRFRSWRTRPLEVVGPAGVREHLRALARLCFGSILDDEALGFPLRYRELPVGESSGQSWGQVRFDTHRMDHEPNSLGYRLEIDGHVLGVTGDTRWCDHLERLARGCDVLFLECTTEEPTALSHVSLAELRQKIDRLEAARIVLVHLTDGVAASLAADPIPRVIAGRDGLSVALRA